jgi:hypothetical protein
MQLIYLSPQYQVVEFSGVNANGFEVIDRGRSCGTYLQGPLADQFRQTLTHIIAEGAEQDSVDEFLGGYDELMHQPALCH